MREPTGSVEGGGGVSTHLRWLITTPVLALVISIGLGWLTYAVTIPAGAVDNVLGPFFAGILIVLLIGPGLVAADAAWSVRVMTGAAVFVGVAGVWFVAVVQTPVTVGQWGQCVLVLGAWVVVLLGAVSFLLALRVMQALAAGVVVVGGLIWLSWPIWMSPWLNGEASAGLVDRLVGCSPLFALNAVLQREGGWTSAPMAYHLTSLGQDVSYSMPAGVGGCVGVHGVVGVLLMAGAYGIGVWGRRGESAEKL